MKIIVPKSLSFLATDCPVHYIILDNDKIHWFLGLCDLWTLDVESVNVAAIRKPSKYNSPRDFSNSTVYQPRYLVDLR